MYCNKREPLGAPHECEFLRNMIVASVAINEEPVINALLLFLRALSKDLNDRSSFQELFSLVAMAYVLRQFGIPVSKEDQDMLHMARKKMFRAHPYAVTLYPDELQWWRDTGRLLESTGPGMGLLELIPQGAAMH